MKLYGCLAFRMSLVLCEAKITLKALNEKQAQWPGLFDKYFPSLENIILNLTMILVYSPGQTRLHRLAYNKIIYSSFFINLWEKMLLYNLKDHWDKIE